MLGRVACIEKGNKAVFVQFDEPCKFKLNEPVNVSSKRITRTLPQNRLYWVFLSWCIHPRGGDLQSQGHFSKDALHQNIKDWLKDTHPQDFNITKKFTTTELDKQEFNRFLEIVKQELMVEFFGIDISGFEIEYEKYGRWTEYSNSEDFRRFMDEKAEVPF